MKPEIQEALLQVLRLHDPSIASLEDFTVEQANLIQAKVSKTAEESVSLQKNLMETTKVAESYRNSLKDRLSKSAALVLDATSASTIIELANRSAAIGELETLTSIYERRAEELFPQKCPKCGVQVSRQSSAQTDPPSAENATPQTLTEHDDAQLKNRIK